ncbi:MAG: lysophospholipid acyltransferase family protein [Planctomycetaceae bacterium]
MAHTLRQRIVAEVATNLGVALFTQTLRHSRDSCRWHLRGPLDAALRRGASIVLCAWHQDVVPLMHYLILRTTPKQRRRCTMLASRSFDGEVTERLLRRWSFRFARGSAGKAGGAEALRALARGTREGGWAIVVGDGPVPPPFSLRSGALFLAREGGIPLFAVRAWARPQLVVPRTWFKMAIPLPRCDIAVFSAGPIDQDGDVEAARLRVEEELERLRRDADAHLYLRESPSGGAHLSSFV